MATPKKQATPRKKSNGKAMTTATATATSMTASAWEQELQQHVGQSSDMMKGVGGGSQFISTRGGNLTYDGATLVQPLPVIILDSVLENVYYEGDYDPDNPAAPVCYAVSREGVKGMAPDDKVPNRQSLKCADCWANQFASAERGKGKACKNTVRLALLPAEQIDDPAAMAEVEPAMMRLPVTSVKHLKGHVSKLEKVLKVPVFGAVTLIETEDSERNQYEVLFKIGERVSDPAVGASILRQRELVQEALVSFPDPSQFSEADKAAPARRKVPVKRQTAPAAKSKRPVARAKF